MLLKVKILRIINAHRISWKELLSPFKKYKKTRKFHTLRNTWETTQNITAFPVMVSKAIPTRNGTCVPQKSKRKRIWNALRDLIPFVQFSACHFTKSNTPPWVFFMFLKIVQMVPNHANHDNISSKYITFIVLTVPFILFH